VRPLGVPDPAGQVRLAPVEASHHAALHVREEVISTFDLNHINIKITKGLRFRSAIADTMALFEVTGRQGRGAWRCVVVNEPWEMDGKTYPSDYAGTTRVFLTEEIVRHVAWEQYAKKCRDAHEAYYASLTVGQIVHYMNTRKEFVRCEVVEKDGKHVLKAIALVGDWYDIGYQEKKIRSGETFTPNYTCIYESPACNRERCAIDPTTAEPIDIGLRVAR